MTKTSAERRQSSRIPVALAALYTSQGRTNKVLTEDISSDGLFVQADEYILPSLTATMEIALPDGGAQPLTLAVATCFIGRSHYGFGVGVRITEKDPDKQSRWLRYYRTTQTKPPSTESQPKDGTLASPLASTLAAPRLPRVMMLERSMTPDLRADVESRGWKLASAVDNVKLLALIEQHTPDVVITDIEDPVLDGIALCKRLTSDRRLANIAVVLLTDRDSPADFIAGLSAGACYVIRKPLQVEHFVSRIMVVLRQRAENGPAPTDREASSPTKSSTERPSQDSGFTFDFLRFPSSLPVPLQKIRHQLSDIYFWTKLYVKHKLRS